MLKTITNSSRCCYLDCPYRYFLEYVMRLSPKIEVEYFAWGSLIHRLCEAYDKGSVLEPILGVAAVREEIEKIQVEVEERGNVKEMQRMHQFLLQAEPTMTGYHFRWETETQWWENLECEKKFALPLSNDWTFRGKLDRIARDRRTGKAALWERKTAAQTGESYYVRLPIDSQLLGYVTVAQQFLGFDLGDVIYDVLKKPGIRRKNEETPDEFAVRKGQVTLKEFKKHFERRSIKMKEILLEGYLSDLQQVTEMIEHSSNEGLWPRHHPGNRRGACAYLGLCLAGTEEVWRSYGFVQRPLETQHPEL